jgi:hypothetical protein
MIGDKALLKEV